MKENIKTVALIVLCTLCIVLIFYSYVSNNNFKNLSTNIDALRDTIKVIQLKNGEEMSVIQGYVLDNHKQFSEYLNIDPKKIKEIESKLGAALEGIAEIKAHVRIDTIKMLDSIYITPDSIILNEFSYNDQWISISGKSEYQLHPLNARTTIDNIIMDVPLEIGYTKKDKWFAIPTNPYVKFSSVNAAHVKPKRWGMGPTLTIGAGYGWGTDFKGGNTNGGLIIGAMIGWSIHYDICQW